MNGSSILSRFERFPSLFGAFARFRHPPQLDLHHAWLAPQQLPGFVKKSPVAQRYLELLGPLNWDRLPERDLQRNWGQTTIPYAAFIPACLLKLNEPKDSMSELRLFLVEHPELIWLFGFPLVVSNPGEIGFDINASLPTSRHLTHLLRGLPNAVLQFLLADSVRLIRETLNSYGIKTGDCISLDTKHILAYVKENNPKAYVSERYDKTKQPAGDPDCKLGCKRRHNRRKTESEQGAPAAPDQPTGKGQSVGEFYWGYLRPVWGRCVHIVAQTRAAEECCDMIS